MLGLGVCARVHFVYSHMLELARCVSRVGEGYSAQLKTLLEEQILPMVEEFDNKLNNGWSLPAATQGKQSGN